MDPKYSNIFWHQGVKVFEETVLKSNKGQIKVDHLENDVTKALINLFQHCSPKVLKAFLQMIDVREAPRAFDFEFQVTDTKAFRQKPHRIMLSIVSASTQMKSSSSYEVLQSYPDACIVSKDNAILIESKTQSPLIQEQIQSHIKHYLGTATKERIITWEEISNKFRLISKSLKDLDRFLVSQFCDFLELIGISEFNGFSELDFSMLGSLGKIPDEDYADFKRMFHRKISKFMDLLKAEVQPILDFTNFDVYISRLPTQAVGTHSGFYFYDEDPKIHINHYPNVNINYHEHFMELTLNAETQSSVKRFLSSFKNDSEKIDIVLAKIPEMKLLIYYKVQFRPMDNFVWDFIPGFPKDTGNFRLAEVLNEIQTFKKQWAHFKSTILYKMKSGMLRHPSGRLFNKTEMDFVSSKNPRPNYAIRFGRQYAVAQMAKKQKGIVIFFNKEIAKLKPLMEWVKP